MGNFGAKHTIFFLIIFLAIKSVLCRGVNISIARNYFSVLPKDGITFLKQLSQILEESGEYGECKQQVDILLSRPNDAIKMLDAWSKVPSGLLWSSGVDHGSFDECLDIDFKEKDQLRVMGKHCPYGILIPYTMDTSKVISESFKLAYCIPNKCNNTHVIKALKLNGTIWDYLINDVYCTTKINQWDGWDIAVASFIFIIVLLMIVSTIYDVFLYYCEANPAHPIFVAFSVYSNGKKLFQISTSKSAHEQILAFNGLKFIGILWIIAGHSGILFYYLPLDNWHEGIDFLGQKYSAYLQTGHLAVDTFFFISGFLLTYLYFKTEANKPVLKQILNVPWAIFHRYLRLTPAVLMVFLVFVFLQTSLVMGPLKDLVQTAFINNCKKHWAAAFLYTQNYFNRDEMCMPQLWYVAADMQMFVVSFLFLIPLSIQYKRKHFKAVLIEMTLLCVIAAILPLLTKLQWQDYDPNFYEYDTHSRIVDYVIGMTLAIFIRQGHFNPNKISPANNVIFWILSLSSMFAGIVLQESIILSDSYINKSVYTSLMRPLWCLGLTYVTWACHNGRGGIINWILSCGLMQVGGKLTYSMYLINEEVVVFWTSTLRGPLHYSNFQLFYTWCGALMVTVILSIFVTLAFESPIITIEKFIFAKRASIPVKPIRPRIEE